MCLVGIECLTFHLHSRKHLHWLPYLGVYYCDRDAKRISIRKQSFSANLRLRLGLSVVWVLSSTLQTFNSDTRVIRLYGYCKQQTLLYDFGKPHSQYSITRPASQKPFLELPPVVQPGIARWFKTILDNATGIDSAALCNLKSGSSTKAIERNTLYSLIRCCLQMIASHQYGLMCISVLPWFPSCHARRSRNASHPEISRTDAKKLGQS